MEVTWRNIGNLPVTNEFAFSTFVFGRFLRISHSQDNGLYAVLGFFDFPGGTDIFAQRRIYSGDKREIIEIPELPFVQGKVGVKREPGIVGWTITIEAGTVDEDTVPTSNFLTEDFL